MTNLKTVENLATAFIAAKKELGVVLTATLLADAIGMCLSGIEPEDREAAIKDLTSDIRRSMSMADLLSAMTELSAVAIVAAA